MNELEKREKVINNIERTREELRCGDYNTMGASGINRRLKWLDDAITLLKAQEPRVMTLEEVLDLKYDDVVYLEVLPTKSVFSAIVMQIIPKLPDIDIGVVQFRFAPTWIGINNADLTNYGKIWRFWTSRPTDEQREAVKWDV